MDLSKYSWTSYSWTKFIIHGYDKFTWTKEIQGFLWFTLMIDFLTDMSYMGCYIFVVFLIV